MKQSNIKINFAARTLILSKKFADAASKVGSAEYYELQNVRNDYPTFEIAVRQIKKNDGKETYQGLTYAYIEMYIKSHPKAAERKKEYDEMRLISQCHSNRFPAIKKWFLATYPEVKNYGILLVDNSNEKEDAPIAA